MGSGGKTQTVTQKVQEPPAPRISPKSTVEDYDMNKGEYVERADAAASPELLNSEDEQKKTANLLG